MQVRELSEQNPVYDRLIHSRARRPHVCPWRTADIGEHWGMGYQAGIDDPTDPPNVQLRSVSSWDFELRTPFAYHPKNGPAIEVPTHPNEFATSTDLASVPPLLWGLLPSYGRQLRAALLHDRLCDVLNKEPDAGKAYQGRRVADDMFLEALRDPGDGGYEDKMNRVGWFRSQLFWTGVAYGRYWTFRKLLALILTVTCWPECWPCISSSGCPRWGGWPTPSLELGTGQPHPDP